MRKMPGTIKQAFAVYSERAVGRAMQLLLWAGGLSQGMTKRKNRAV